jgi:hypothetical protein
MLDAFTILLQSPYNLKEACPNLFVTSQIEIN